MASDDDLSVQRMRDKVAELRAAGPQAVATARVGFSPWHRAAAVLASFDEALKPAGDEHATDARDGTLLAVVADSLLATGADGHARYVLLPTIRRAVLQAMGTREAMQAARRANAGDAADPHQRILDAWLGDVRTLTTVASIPASDLLVAFEVSSWLAGTIAGVPESADIRARLDAEELLAPFDLLVGDHFGGRERELQQLSDYVEVLPATSAWSWTTRVVREVFSLRERPPLLIYGPGGLGKSTLIAKFIIDHARVDEDKRFPYAYLDFDRPELLAAEPLTVLLEAVRQFGIQHPRDRDTCEALRIRWQQQILRERESTRSRPTASGVEVASDPVVQQRDRFIRDFANLVRQLKMDNRPVLLVLDTFEEVQYRSRVFVAEIWKFLEELQIAVPRLRVVIAGRSILTGYPSEPLPLRDLDPDAAVGFLMQRKIPQPTAIWLASRLGGNPLTLRLATQLLATTGADVAEMAFADKVDAAEIQRQLYVRIVKHIHDPDVRRLAHPGLVLRKVTAEIIRDVLAGPCDVSVPTMERARELFDEMARETSLVSGGDEELRHRPDVRRVMLKSLVRDPDVASRIPAIHEQAIVYYARRYDRTGAAADRAEEIYHRLAMGQVDHEMVSRWVRGVDLYLYNAVEELPPASRAWLSTQLRVELSEEDREHAELDVWEQDAARRARESLAVGDPAGALNAIHEREGRSDDSPLFLIEALALERQGDYVAARDQLRRARGLLFESGNKLRLLEITSELVTTELHLSRPPQARDYLTEALALADALDDAPARLRLRVAEADLRRDERRLHGAINRGQPSTEAASRDADVNAYREYLSQVATALGDLADDQLRADASSARMAAALLIEGDWQRLVARVVETVGIGSPPRPLLQELGRVLESWDMSLRPKDERRLNLWAATKIVHDNFAYEEVARLLPDALKKEVGLDAHTWNDPARWVVRLTLDQVYELIGQLEKIRPGVTANIGKSIGPIGGEATLAQSDEGTLESLMLAGPPTAIATSLSRIIQKFGLGPMADVLRQILSWTTPPEPDAATAESISMAAPKGIESLRVAASPTLSGPQKRTLLAGLVRAYPTRGDLERFVLDAIDTNLTSISARGPLESTALEMVQWAEAQGLLENLVEAAYASRPRNMEIREVAEALGVTAAIDNDVLSRVLPIDFPREEWLATLNRIEHQMCRISCGRAKGTAWLIGPDLLLTARGIVAELIDGSLDPRGFEAAFRAVTPVAIREAPSRLADDWLVAESSASEFAILRLRDRLGLRPALPGAYGFRQWIPLRQRARSSQGATVVVPFRSDTGRREISIRLDGLAVIGPHTITYRRAADEAATGAPIFNNEWELLALRVAPPARWPLGRAADIRAIPIGEIVDYLDAHGLGPLIDKEFPAT